MSKQQTLLGATSIASAAAALANIKAQRDSMNKEQAALEIPLVENALAILEQQGAELLDLLQETRESVIHPMAREQLGHIFVVIENVPNALRQVLAEHQSAVAVSQTITPPVMIDPAPEPDAPTE